MDVMPASSPKRPRDPNQLGKLIVDIATGEADDPATETPSAAAVSGRKGGLNGGRARADKLSPAERTEIARTAARARWDKKKAAK
jgi:hypothetical protein